MKTCLFLLSLIFTLEVFAQANCQEKARELAFLSAQRTFGPDHETRTVCGARLLDGAGVHEIYLVGISDEVEPSEFLVIVEKGSCKKKFVSLHNDSQSRFDFNESCQTF